MRARIGTAFTVSDEKPRSSITAAIGIETFIVSGLPQASATASRRQRASRTCGPLTPRCVGELEDPLGARVERPVHRMAEAGHPARRHSRSSLRELARATAAGCAPDATLACAVFEQPRAGLGRAEDDRAAAEDPRRDGSLQRARVGRQRHARGDVGGHHPVLGDRDQQQVEEEALVLGRLAAREQQVEVLREAQAAHQVAGEVAAADLDPVGIGLADMADGGPALTDLHAASRRYGP